MDLKFLLLIEIFIINVLHVGVAFRLRLIEKCEETTFSNIFELKRISHFPSKIQPDNHSLVVTILDFVNTTFHFHACFKRLPSRTPYQNRRAQFSLYS